MYTVEIGEGAAVQHTATTEDEMWYIVRNLMRVDPPHRPQVILVFRDTGGHDERIMTLVPH